MMQNIKSPPTPLLSELFEKWDCIVLKKPNTSQLFPYYNTGYSVL